MTLPLFWWNDMPNFGDRLNVDVCRSLFGLDATWVKPKRCGAVFIGSVLENFLYKRRRWTVDSLWIKYCRRKVDVWGSGFIMPPECQTEKVMRRLRVHAVRGYKTLSRLQKSTGCPMKHVVLGDPGLLASKVVAGTGKPSCACGIIPHHAEVASVSRNAETVLQERELGVLQHSTVRAMPAYERLVDLVPGAVVINPESLPTIVLERIASCNAILSSAMHGLIVSDSFGIPNVRIVASDIHVGGDYKFNDYYSVFSRDRHRRLDIRGDLPSRLLEYVANGYVNAHEEVAKIQDRLMESFPAKGARGRV